ncbi:MAG: hypothetical protein NTU95_12360 [Methanothrix sp.]|nr:hypothetical protein [Methanothrix sp.]
MILCVQIEKLGSQLSKLAQLMDKYQRGEPSFADDALKWLEESEKTISTLRLPEGSEMSALRGRIIKAASVSSNTEGHSTRGAQRLARGAAAAESLERAEAIMRGRLHSSEERLRLFEEKLCEGMTALMLQTPLPEKTLPNMERLKYVWELLREQQSTRPLALYLAASLSPSDRSFILDRVLNRVYNEELGELPSLSEQ